MIFSANMVISIVLIGSMMTRTFCISFKVGRIGLEGYWVTGHYTRPILWGHGGLGDLKTSTFFKFFGIFRILTSNGTRKCFGSKEKSNFCKMKHPSGHFLAKTPLLPPKVTSRKDDMSVSEE